MSTSPDRAPDQPPHGPVPASLRRWFVVHCFVDLVVAVPLLLAPTAVLTRLGWTQVDPVSARVAAAALFAIGTQSFLGRNAGRETYRAMLNLKLLWSGAALLGLFLSIGEGAPDAAFAFLAVFLVFFGVWFHHRIRMKQLDAVPDEAVRHDSLQGG